MQIQSLSCINYTYFSLAFQDYSNCPGPDTVRHISSSDFKIHEVNTLDYIFSNFNHKQVFFHAIFQFSITKHMALSSCSTINDYLLCNTSLRFHYEMVILT